MTDDRESASVDDELTGTKKICWIRLLAFFIPLALILATVVAFWPLDLSMLGWERATTGGFSEKQEVRKLQARLDVMEQQVQRRLTKFSQIVPPLGVEPISYRLAEAEVEFLLIMAMHRLSLGRELDAAQATLAEAERRLENLPVAGANEVSEYVQAMRQELAGQLAVQEQTRTRLNDLSDALASLPWQSLSAEKTGMEEESGWLPNLKKWIVIRQADRAPEATPASAMDARSLALSYALAMEMAWMRGDTLDFQRKLNSLRQMVQERFPVGHIVAGAVLGLLSELAETEVQMIIDDSALYSALEMWRALGALPTGQTGGDEAYMGVQAGGEPGG